MKKKSNENKEVRKFKTGATRDTDCGKLDYEGFLSPLVLERYAKYMNTHRIQSDGTVRSSDNWQKGIPEEVYMKSMWRHFMDIWKSHRNCEFNEEALCALMFNVMGMLHEQLASGSKLGESFARLFDTHTPGKMADGMAKLVEEEDEEATQPVAWIIIDDPTDEPEKKPAKSNVIGIALGMAFGALAIGCVGFGLYHLITGALA